MSELDCAGLARLALLAARAGASVLSEQSNNPVQARRKDTAGNLVTAADVASEEEIRAILVAARPADRINGEELAGQGPVNARIQWFIDPLDGTMNFVRRIPYFATSVAAYDRQDDHWLAGAVVAPALRRDYWAGRGIGAQLRAPAAGGVRATRKLEWRPPDASERILGTGFSYSPDIRRQQFRSLPELMEGFVDIRRMGSAALEICAVADGSLDAYWEYDLAIHDWAAALLIAEQAGASVHRPDHSDGAVSVNLF
jgi:myo-inositol-1(or 4)-monophosphatase